MNRSSINAPTSLAPSRKDLGDQPSRGSSPAGRIPALDGLRGLAMLMVFVAHGVASPLWVGPGGPELATLDRAVGLVAEHGWLGLDIFFVLSGFLITGILLDTRGQPHWWRNFFVRRALRILPLYYGALIFLFILLPLVTHWSAPEYAALRGHQVWYWTHSVNLLGIVHGFDQTQLNTGHFWSLSVEEHFYALWPFVVAACRPRALIRVIGVTVALGLILRLWLVLQHPQGALVAYVFTPTRLDALLTGSAIATVARLPGGLALLTPWVGRILGGGGLALALLGLARGGIIFRDPVVAVIGFPMIALMIGAVLVAALTVKESHWLRRTLDQPTLRGWGIYSYAIYVFHYPFIGLLLWKVPGLVQPVSVLGGSRLPGIVVLFGMALVVSYSAGWLSYHLFERRFLDLKRYFTAA